MESVNFDRFHGVLPRRLRRHLLTHANRSIWDLYGVDRPMWANVWDRTVHWASRGEAAFPLAAFVEPRIEPEVAFKLVATVPVTDDPVAVLDAVEWFAPAFEIVRCPFPGWRFTLPDCTAAFGLHGALATFEVTLRRADSVVDRGTGTNVLDSPALALSHLARVLAELPQLPPLSAGEIVTTGTITNAWPVAPGETWGSDYGSLGLAGLTVTFN